MIQNLGDSDTENEEMIAVKSSNQKRTHPMQAKLPKQLSEEEPNSFE